MAWRGVVLGSIRPVRGSGHGWIRKASLRKHSAQALRRARKWPALKTTSAGACLDLMLICCGFDMVWI